MRWEVAWCLDAVLSRDERSMQEDEGGVELEMQRQNLRSDVSI